MHSSKFLTPRFIVNLALQIFFFLSNHQSNWWFAANNDIKDYLNTNSLLKSLHFHIFWLSNYHLYFWSSNMIQFKTYSVEFQHFIPIWYFICWIVSWRFIFHQGYIERKMYVKYKIGITLKCFVLSEISMKNFATNHLSTNFCMISRDTKS